MHSHPSHEHNTQCPFTWFLFDFGGVLAEEGFAQGLRALARAEGLDPEHMLATGIEQVFATGFVLGRAKESTFWQAVRQATGLQADDAQCRATVLDLFVPRPWMLDLVDRLRKAEHKCAILSDQVTWLDVLDQRHNIFSHFEQIFNSYHLGKSKRDPTLFTDVLSKLNIQAEQAIFIDDSEGNVARARDQGLYAIHYQSRDDFLHRFHSLCPGV